MEIIRANRKQSKIKMALQGPSGSGKTYSALLLAFGLVNNWSKIAVIDSERHSSHLYAHLGAFNVLSLSEPFSPERYCEAMEVCEAASMEVIIIDSISHEWEGEGGILDSHSNMVGNSFTNWGKITPRHNAFVNKMLQSQAHIIGTIRAKQDYVLSEKNGKSVPEKVGLKGVTRDGMDYEFTIVFELDLKHNTTSTKDRTGLFMDKPSFIITPETGLKIMRWCEQGVPFKEVVEKIGHAQTIDELRQIFKDFPEYRKQIDADLHRRKAELEAQDDDIVLDLLNQNIHGNGADTGE